MAHRSTTSRRSRAHRRARRTVSGVFFAVLAMAAGLLLQPVGPAAAAEGQTWVVNAVDDEDGNRWESVDTDSSTVTIEVGDTVEWQFVWGIAGQAHDLTSQDTSTAWTTPVAVHRNPGDDPFRYTFDEPGVYDYICSTHGTVMKGTVVVVDPDSENQQPTVNAGADPASGTAPLAVHFMATASDPEDDPLSYQWDFGDAEDDTDRANGPHQNYVYETPGSYTATLEVTDGFSGVVTRTFPIQVDEPGAGSLPEFEALVSPSSGDAPLAVGFSTKVRTQGEFHPFAHGAEAYPELAGSAELVRERGSTYAMLDVTGLASDALHAVHVHEEACASNDGGAHFRFDESKPFHEDNEIWLPFTSSEGGASGRVEVTEALRAGPKAVSIVVHDPENPALRIGCVDLEPSTADLSYAWEFGDGTTGAGPDPDHTYTHSGSHTATVTVSNDAGESRTDSVDVTVDEPGAGSLPEFEALVSPSSGDAPLAVGFSTKVRTQGEFHPFAHGAEAYPELAGSAELVRERGSTYAMLDVTGLASDALHAVHVHEEACASNDGGAHFRFDESKPFHEDNEIWLPFTSSEGGASGRVEVTEALRAGPKAVSIVVHDPENPALRIGCVDLEPSTADLSYAWEFGDGTTGAGPDPDHTYTADGTYDATVTVSNAAGDEATASVEVVVDSVAPQTRLSAGPKGSVRAAKATFRFASSEADSTFSCRLDARAWKTCTSPVTYRKLRQGAHRLRVRATDAAGNADATPVQRRWVVDTRGPVVTGKRPATTRDRTPTIRATVRDRHSKVRAKDLRMRVDGRATPGLRYVARTGRVAWTPRRTLAPGRHVVRLTVRDAVGNRTVTSWRFTVRR
ncbi:PKD domain-containing protein [Nocardioides sp. BGMRC 2183]|nr:PKD domain-containing protein [Nocardioides sp. BGMRC 2183]